MRIPLQLPPIRRNRRTRPFAGRGVLPSRADGVSPLQVDYAEEEDDVEEEAEGAEEAYEE